MPKAIIDGGTVATPTAAQFRAAEAVASGNATATEKAIAATIPPATTTPANIGSFGLLQFGMNPATGQPLAGSSQVAQPVQPVTPTVDPAIAALQEQMQQQLLLMLQQMQKQQTDFQNALAAQQKQYEAQQAAAMQKSRQSAFESMQSKFTQMGVPELGNAIAKIYKGEGVDRFGKAITDIPTSSEGFYLALINTPEYYERFGKVNEARLQAGYRALDEATIVKMEDSYQKVMEAYNLPKGFYDQTADYQTFLKNNKDAEEVAGDIQAYRDFVDAAVAAKPEVFDALQNYYGVDKGAITAYMIDPTRGQPILESIAGKNKNAAAALIQGLSENAATEAFAYGAGSMGYAALKQKYSAVAQDITQTGRLADVYGMNYGQREAIAQEFGGDAAAAMQQQRVRATGMSQFAGSTGIGGKALGGRTSGMQ